MALSLRRGDPPPGRTITLPDVRSRPPRRLGRFIGWTALAATGGALLAVGAVLDWSTLRLGSARIARSGLDSGGGGGMVGALGVVLVGATVVRLSRRARRLLGPLAIAIGAAVAVVITVDLVALAAPIETNGEVAVTTIGPGVWVAAFGALIALTAGTGLVKADRPRGRGVRR